MPSNDMSKIGVGTRLFHRTIKDGPERIVVIRELRDPCIYQYEDDGHTASTPLAMIRQMSKFRPAGDAPARPLPRVELREPPPDAVPEVVIVDLPNAIRKLPIEPATFQIEGWTLARLGGDQDEPRIRDLDLAERLGYERPRDIRELIKRMVEAGELPGISMRRMARRIEIRANVYRDQEVDEFWLTEEEAVLVAVSSRTPKAIAIKREVVHVFTLARRGQLPQQTPALGMSDVLHIVDQIVERTTAPMWEAIAALKSAVARPEPAAAAAKSPVHRPSLEWRGSDRDLSFVASLARAAGRNNGDRVGWMLHRFFESRSYWPPESVCREALIARGVNPMGPPTKKGPKAA
jgi:hypothetical protein